MTCRIQTAAALFAAAALAACAGGDAPPSASDQQVFDAADANADGVLTQVEWVAYADRAYTGIDADLNDKVSVEDVEAAFGVFDQDGDGVLSPSEASSAEMDANGDGRITQDEWNAALVHARMDVNGDGNVSRSEVRLYSSRGMRSFDRDGDSRVSRAEAADSEQFTLWRF